MSRAPKISVIMPVYNGQNYLREAIHSILSQTFADFELLIIDDGSTDESVRIAHGYEDPRILLFGNETNKGIVNSLNKGIGLAGGEYIAIMHADDVSMPTRLELQARFLDSHPEVSMVAAKTSLIDISGKDIGYWPADHSAVTHNEISALLPKTNCIAHPSIMIRRNIALSFPYDEKQNATEDYHLWLRLVAENHRIEKLEEVLLKYRIHPTSITSRTNTDLYKEMRTKASFLMEAARKGRGTVAFHRKVLKHLILDFCRIHSAQLKNAFMRLLRTLFISLGKPFGVIYSRCATSSHGVVFFFPFTFDHVGGSERVHADIVASNLQKAPWVVVANEWHRIAPQEVDDPCKTTHLSPLLRNPITKHLAIGFFAGYINSTRIALFGGNCEFFYWLLPHLYPQVFCIDIIHAYDCIMHEISLPQVMRIDRRLVLAEELREGLVSVYRQHGIPEDFARRIELVDYGVEVPDALPLRQNDIMQILYVGRGIEEKRVHLVGRIARCLAERNAPVNVSLVGDVLESVAEEDRQFCTFHGIIRDRELLQTHYSRSDILLLTSSTEGVSLVKMEAMAFGVVPFVVAVGGVPGHITDGVTGFLVRPDQDEGGIIRDFCDIIENVINNRSRLDQISCNAYHYAKTHFDRSRCLSRFKELLDNPC